MSLPPGLWALPSGLDPDVRKVLEDLLAHVDALDEKVADAQAEAKEAYGMVSSGPDPWEVEQALDDLEERVEELSDEVDALKGEVEERAS